MDTYDELPDVFQKKHQSSELDYTVFSEKAAAVIADLTQEYPSWARKDVEAMLDLWNQSIQEKGVNRYRLVREDLFRHAHDIKGQGATFGYPLMTELGTVVCDYLRYKSGFNDEDLAVIKKYIDDMVFVLDQCLTGDGGQQADAIREHLKEAENFK